MKYLVTVTFEVKDGTKEDYKKVYKELESLGFFKILKASNGNIVTIPTSTVVSEVDGTNADLLKNTVRDKLNIVFKACKVKGEAFIIVSSDWAWGASSFN